MNNPYSVSSFAGLVAIITGSIGVCFRLLAPNPDALYPGDTYAHYFALFNEYSTVSGYFLGASLLSLIGLVSYLLAPSRSLPYRVTFIMAFVNLNLMYLWTSSSTNPLLMKVDVLAGRVWTFPTNGLVQADVEALVSLTTVCCLAYKFSEGGRIRSLAHTSLVFWASVFPLGIWITIYLPGSLDAVVTTFQSKYDVAVWFTNLVLRTVTSMGLGSSLVLALLLRLSAIL